MERIDVRAFKRAHPLAEVAARYGVELRPSGRALVGRCPFHPDGGRPNLHVYPAADAADDAFFCYRCPLGGDVIRFVELLERVPFRQAVEHLAARSGMSMPLPQAPVAARWRPHGRAMGAIEQACLAAAVELYANRLASDLKARRYLEQRGIGWPTAEACRLGYAAGGELAAYLRWRRLPIPAAVRAGLLDHRERELMAGRLVIPEIRAGRPIWIIGRAIDAQQAGPKYLGLPGPKPLLGWEFAAGADRVCLTEGPFDWLALRAWSVPALALAGTYVRPKVLNALGRFERLYLLLDNDDAGREATRRLMQGFGPRAVPVALPGVKDVAELAVRPNGCSILQAALEPWQPGVAAA